MKLKSIRITFYSGHSILIKNVTEYSLKEGFLTFYTLDKGILVIPDYTDIEYYKIK